MEIQAAIQFEKDDMLQHYIKKGCSIDNVPDTVSKLYIDHTRQSEYRKSPFIIQAACQGNLHVFETLIKHGSKANDEGFIGFSSKRKNQIISNVVGAAAFHNSSSILRHVIKKKSVYQIEFKAKEALDFAQKGPLKKEYDGYTPLLLAVAGGGQNAECIRILISNKADLTASDAVNNSVLHIAAINQNVPAMEELLKSWPEASLIATLTTRNAAGETPLSIAITHKNQKLVDLLEAAQRKVGDLTQKTTEDLLDSLEKEEAKRAKEKERIKQKKQNKKLKQIAEKESLTVEEIQARHQAENEQKRLEQLKKEQEEEERLRREFEDVAAVERRRQTGQQSQTTPISSVIKTEEKKHQPRKSVQFSEQVQVQTTAQVDTQFAQIKIRKPEVAPQTEQKKAPLTVTEIPKEEKPTAKPAT